MSFEDEKNRLALAGIFCFYRCRNKARGYLTMKLKPIKEMSLGERGKEIKKLRQSIIRWAEIYLKNGDERCHEEDEKLASLVGLSLYKGRSSGIRSARIFNSHCDKYINRECNAGRLIDDR
ncbi:MAG: hypothetical protein Q8Q06_04620 [bacterium]|nr:hypothetical protein [bacterium]